MRVVSKQVAKVRVDPAAVFVIEFKQTTLLLLDGIASLNCCGGQINDLSDGISALWKDGIPHTNTVYVNWPGVECV